MSCPVNSFKDCTMSVGGIAKIFLFPFKAITKPTYLGDNFSLIDTYQADALGVEIGCLQVSSRLDEVMEVGATPVFVQTLTLTISKMEWAKRIEIVKMIRGQYQFIVQDRNGKSWLMGLNQPARLTEYGASTEEDGGANTYQLVFTCRAAEMIKEIGQYSTDCAITVIGTQIRQSVFTIPSASSYDFSGLYELLGDDVTRGIAPTSWQPTLWNSDPFVLATDQNVLANLINQNGNSAVEAFLYDAGTDTVIFSILSTDTSYTLMTIGGQVIVGSVNVLVRLQTLYSASLSNVVITVTDSTMTTLWSASAADVISGTGISGRAEDGYIDVTTLYPLGEVFSVAVAFDGTECAFDGYTYIYEAPTDCLLETSYSIHNGRRYTIEVDVLQDGEKYREMELVIGKYNLYLYTNFADYHSDDALFVADLTALLSGYPDLGISNVQIFTGTTKWEMLFDSIDDNLDFYVIGKGVDNSTVATAGSDTMKYLSNRTILMALQTIAPSDSFINIDNLDNTQFTDGQYNLPPSAGDMILEDVPTVTSGITRSLGIDISQWAETDDISVGNVSAACPDITTDFQAATCLDTIEQTNDWTYFLLFQNVALEADPTLGNSVTFELAVSGFVTFTIPADITAANIADMTDAIQADPRFRNVNFQYDSSYARWWLEIITDKVDYLVDVQWSTPASAMSLANKYSVWRYEMTPKQHPDIDVSMNLQTALLIDTRAGKVKDPLSLDNKAEQVISTVIYNSGADTLDVTFTSNRADWTVSFHNAFPVTGNELYQFTLPEPSLAVTIAAFSTLLTTTNINYLRLRNGDGYEKIIEYTLPALNNVIVEINSYTIYKQAWGRFDDFELLYDFGVTPPNQAIVRNSILCPNTDADVLFFLSQTGITNPVIEEGLDIFVKTIKAVSGLWEKHHAIYPFVGGTAFTHKFNLKNPLDTDAAFRLAFTGGITHNSNGITPNGINGYANTFYTETINSVAFDRKHISIYSRLDILGAYTDMAAYDGTTSATDITPRTFSSGERCLMRNGNVSGSNFLNANSRGWFLNNRVDASNIRARVGATLVPLVSVTAGAVNRPYFIGANNLAGTAGSFSIRNLCYASIGEDLSDAESLIMYNAILALQTYFSRA